MTIINVLSVAFIPFIVGFILVYGTWKKVETYDAFVEGGKEGLKVAISVLPFLVGMLVAIFMFRASGALDFFLSFIRPYFQAIGVPAEVAPLALMRTISGTAALGMTTDLIATHGPDSYIGRLASTIQGSTDTTIYILTVYFGAVGIKKMGDALKVGLLADFVSFVVAVIIVTLLFGRG